jgi:putative membrane protein
LILQGYYFKGVGIEYLFNIGFLGTRAPYYMDGIIVYLLLLPIFILFSISLASNREYALHRFTQKLLFLLTSIALFSFNYGIHIIESFDALVALSSTEYNYAFSLLIIQTVLSIFMLVLWLSTLLFAISDRRRRALPGFYSRSHKISGRRLFMIIIASILFIIYFYWTIYVA